jgi:SH3-like domain-containing protein
VAGNARRAGPFPTTGTLEARLPVQVTDRQGEWAHVVCSNGWSAWIDARNLKVQ